MSKEEENNKSTSGFSNLAKVGLSFLVFLSIVIWVLDSEGPPQDEHSMMYMLGTWNQEGKDPGSYLRLYSEKTDQTIGVELLEGKGHIEKCLGFEKEDFTWGFENYDPLILNIVLKNNSPRYFAIKVMGKNNLSLLMSTEAKELYKVEFDKAKTVKFKRAQK